MSGSENLYENWLGIATGDQPPTYYQLLGLRDFESNLAKVANGAQRQLARVKAAAGPVHAAAAGALIEQIRMAERCLSTPETKAAYDRHLQAKSTRAPASAQKRKASTWRRLTLFSSVIGSVATVVLVVGFSLNARQGSIAPTPDGASSATATVAAPPLNGQVQKELARPAVNAARAMQQQPQRTRAAPNENETAPDRETTSWPPAWLRLDEHGEPCEATLADGSMLKLDTYGETYQGYDFKPPVDVAIVAETVVDYAKLDRHVELYAIQIDAADRKMYWIEMHGDKWQKLSCANLNGDNVKIIVSIDFQSPMGLALDTVNRKIYWTSHAPFPAFGKPASAKSAIWRANFDGSDPEPVFGGLQMPRAVAVDPNSKSIFYFDNLRLVRGGLDGNNEKLLLDQASQGVHYSAWWTAIDPARRKLFWSSDAAFIASVNLDGSGLKAPLTNNAHISGVALDLHNEKMYWTERSYQEIWRANFDGSQAEAIAFGLYCPRGIDLDADGFAYWTDYKPAGGGAIGNIRRVKLPPVSKSRATPAPPLIRSLTPPSQRPGGKISLRGDGFSRATRVDFIDDDGKHSDAKFTIESASEITVVVPETGKPGSRASIVVQGAGGVTVTLPHDVAVIHPRGTPASRGPTRYDHFNDAGKLAFVVEPAAWFVKVENSIVYCPNNASVHAGLRGAAILFLKNGARAVINDAPKMVVFHEPFVQMRRRVSAAPDAVFVPVRAIRPSFVESLFEYEE